MGRGLEEFNRSLLATLPRSLSRSFGGLYNLDEGVVGVASEVSDAEEVEAEVDEVNNLLALFLILLNPAPEFTFLYGSLIFCASAPRTAASLSIPSDFELDVEIKSSSIPLFASPVVDESVEE